MFYVYCIFKVYEFVLFFLLLCVFFLGGCVLIGVVVYGFFISDYDLNLYVEYSFYWFYFLCVVVFFMYFINGLLLFLNVL